MVKISAQILGQVIGNSETLYPPPKRQRFHHPQNNTGARLLPESQQIHPPSLEWEVQVQNKALTSETYWLPAHTPPCMVGSELDTTIARKSHAMQGKRGGFMKNPKFIANYILLPFVLHFYRIY